MIDASELVIVFVTVPNKDTAKLISTQLLSERLIACVNILPEVESIFHWQGKLDQATELLLLMKTKRQLVGELKQKITELHPYDTPEIVVTAMVDVAEKYGAWVQAETK